MKNLNKLINSILISISVIVLIIFVIGVIKKYSNNSAQLSKIEESSVSNVVTSNQSLVEQEKDELTNKYMKELQIKLKTEELESLNQIKKTQVYQKQKNKIVSKIDDWSHVSADQQISKDEEVAPSRSTSSVRRLSVSAFKGVNLNKDNANDFIETARRNGYQVILSENYEVISVTPILKNDSFENKGINDTQEIIPNE